MTKFRKDQVGYIAQQLRKAVETHNQKTLTVSEKNFIREVGFLLSKVNNGKYNSMVAGITKYAQEIQKERKTELIAELEKDLKKLKEEKENE